MVVFPGRLPGQILAPDEGIQVFRAPTPSARLDWVTALAIVATAHDLGIWKPLKETSIPPSSAERVEGGDNHAGGAADDERKCGNGSDSGICQGENGGAIYVVRRSLGLGGKRRRDRRDVGGVQGGPREYMLQKREEEEEEEEEWGRTEAVGGEGTADGPAARIVMQGFLKKRMAGRLWAVWEGWEYRWVVLRVRHIVVP